MEHGIDDCPGWLAFALASRPITAELEDAMSLVFNPELVLSTTIAKTETLSAKLGDFPQAAVDKFLAYGFQRFFNDGLGGKDVPDADKVKAAKLKFEQAKKGIVGRTRGATPDPFVKIVIAIVKRLVKAKNAENYKKIMAEEKPDAKFLAILERTKENKPETYAAIMAEATAERKRQEEMAEGLANLIADSEDDL